MKKKSKKRVFIILGIILISVAIYFICFYRGTTEENKKTLTVAEEITLNDNEKELLSELINVNDKLLNPTKKEDAETQDYTEVAKPTEPISLKDFCMKLYETRKTTNEQGETVYLFDMETKGKNTDVARRIIVTRNGEMVFCTFVESDYETLTQTETTANEDGINLGTDFAKALLQGLSKSVNEMWENATQFDNVNYDNILNKI